MLTALSAQEIKTEWVTDTLQIFPGDSLLNLTHHLVLDGTVIVENEATALGKYTLDSKEGNLVLSQAVAETMIVIINYEYISTQLPEMLEPPLNDLPLLEEISSFNKKPMQSTVSEFIREDYPLVTNGSIFRGISISPLSGVAMTGGLRLMLQGQMAEDVTVTGSLTDQNSPIQPEGNTQALDEIDEVYLEVKHPSAQLLAGDIDLNMATGQYVTLSRRLEGVSFKGGKSAFEGGVILGSTKGKFAKLDFIGEDQNQGPYRLFSETGSRNIIVMAGSERVWLDGEKLTRGENFDYTIDYSTGEITFTAQNLIDSNSRIYVEYEYSDLVYPRNIAAVTGEFRSTSKKSKFTISWLREKDNTRSDLLLSLKDEEMELLKESGDEDVTLTTYQEDSTGNYRIATWIDTPRVTPIFVYVPTEEKTEEEIYYRVSFFNMGSDGEYLRQVNEDGKIFFIWIPLNERNNLSDLYVPWRTIKTPESHQILDINGTLTLGEKTELIFELSGSQRDRNSLSFINDENNAGAAGFIQFSHSQKLPRNIGILDITTKFRRSDNRFYPFQRDRRVEFDREWNLATNDAASAENITEIEIKHHLGALLETSFNYGSYRDSYQSANRWEGGVIYRSKWIPLLEVTGTAAVRDIGSPNRVLLLPINPSRVDSSDSGWLRKQIDAILLPGKFHPLFRSLEEERTADFKFDEKMTGIQIEWTGLRATLGVTRRIDYEGAVNSDSLQEWEEVSDSWLGELDLTSKWRNGFRTQLSVRQKMKTFSSATEDISYGLVKGSFGYRRPRSIVNLNLDIRLEQSLFEEKIAVFDSVGAGLGNYRYDRDYNQYFPDPVGNYIVYHIPSGHRIPSAHLTSGMQMMYDFRRSNIDYLSDFTWKVYARTDFKGNHISTMTVFSPELNDSTINQSRFSIRSELTYAPRATRRKLRLSSKHQTNLATNNFSGDLFTEQNTIALSAEEPLSRKVLFFGGLSRHIHNVESTTIYQVRSLQGWVLRSGLSWQSSKILELGVSSEYGEDIGDNFYESFSVSSTVFSLHSQLFSRQGGRIETSLDYILVKSDDDLISLLPPEAAGGRQVGSSFIANITGFLVLGENISANAHVSYIQDPLHDGILTITGEIRATL